MQRVVSPEANARVHEAAQALLDASRAAAHEILGAQLTDANIAARTALQIATQGIAQADLGGAGTGQTVEVTPEFIRARVNGIADGLGYTIGSMCRSGPMLQIALATSAFSSLEGAIMLSTEAVLKKKAGS